jgi:hypothetical protein
LYIPGGNADDAIGMTADGVLEGGTEKCNVCANVGVVIRPGKGGRNTAGRVVPVVVHAQAGNVARVGAVDDVLGTRMGMKA